MAAKSARKVTVSNRSDSKMLPWVSGKSAMRTARAASSAPPIA